MSQSIYSGIWINWEHGIVDGATLTLPTVYGLILVSFLTLFVQYAGGCAWRVICLVLHQTRSTTTPRDGLYHQQQVVLRNAVTAPNALWSFTRLGVAWRGKTKVPLKYTSPLVLVTALHIACFGAAGLLSSQIASTKAGQALVVSNVCGYPKQLAAIRTVSLWNLSEADLNIFNAQVLLGRFTMLKSTAYVKSCYSGDSREGSTDCNIFVQPFLGDGRSPAVANSPCPFGDDSCATKAASFDSGPIDSSIDLGINYPARDGLTFRRKTTCAPILTNKYATGWRSNLTEAYGKKTNTSINFYEFGKADRSCVATPLEQQTNRTTFCVSQYMKDYLPSAYTFAASTAYSRNSSASDFVPIPAFQVNDADVVLISIFNKAIYNGKVDDVLYNAQNQSTVASQFFTATNDLAVLGCTEQYQFCNPTAGKCTELSGLYDVQKAVMRGDLSLSSRQQATFEVMWEAAWGMAFQWGLRLLGSQLLLASDWLYTTGQSSAVLPSDQWLRESHNLHNLSLAVFQRRINQFSSPDRFDLRPGLNALDEIDIPTDKAVLELCKRQRVVSTNHYSVSVLGMFIILGLGSFLILLNLVVEKYAMSAHIFTNWRITKKAEWTQTGTLQLHRQALEARGVGSWDMKSYDFPVLNETGQTFTGLGTREEELGTVQAQGRDIGEKSYQYSTIEREVTPNKVENQG